MVLCSPRAFCSGLLLLFLYIVAMELLLAKCVISNILFNAPSCDIAKGLDDVNLESLNTLREELFNASKKQNLTDNRDVLVNRRDTVANPVRKKLIEDIFNLDRCVKNKEAIPRTLLNGGKRSKEDFEAIRNKNTQPLLVAPSVLVPSNGTTDDATSSSTEITRHSMSRNACSSSPAPQHVLQQEIHTLRKEIDTIKSSLTSIQPRMDTTDNTTIATLSTEVEMLRAIVKGKLDHNVSLRVEDSTCTSVTEGVSQYRHSDISFAANDKPGTPSIYSTIRITTWNCRGLSTAGPYLEELAKVSDIIVLEEHWLWPYCLCKLDSLLDGFSAFGCSDKRLAEGSSLSLNRGCGGVAILWRKHLLSTPVTAIQSDRIVAIQLPLEDSASLSIIGVNLPSTDHPASEYSDYLLDLESTISSFQACGPTLVAGDFNAHLGHLGCNRNNDSPN